MDGTARIAFSSHILSPRSCPTSSSCFCLAQSPSAVESPRGFGPMSPVASYSPPLTPTNRVCASMFGTSPRPACPRPASFKGFDESLGSSLKNFEKNFNGCLKRKKRAPISVTAGVGCPTEQKQDIPINTTGSSGIRKTYYSILGVKKWASLKEIRLAYRKLALQFHPDVAPLHQLDTVTKLFSQINEAYQTLSDPQKRRYYDLSLELQSPTTMAVEYGTARKYTDMSTGRVYPSLSSFYREWKGSHNWETDRCWC